MCSRCKACILLNQQNMLYKDDLPVLRNNYWMRAEGDEVSTGVKAAVTSHPRIGSTHKEADMNVVAEACMTPARGPATTCSSDGAGAALDAGGASEARSG